MSDFDTTCVFELVETPADVSEVANKLRTATTTLAMTSDLVTLATYEPACVECNSETNELAVASTALSTVEVPSTSELDQEYVKAREAIFGRVDPAKYLGGPAQTTTRLWHMGRALYPRKSSAWCFCIGVVS